jgi:hypothetical protein
MTLGSLDFMYTPSADVAADLRYLVDVLGAEQVFAIEDGGIRVAMVSFGPAPAILAAARGEFEARGLRPERSVELPPGPATTFRTPGGLRMAIYQPVRPFVVESFRGRRDFAEPSSCTQPASRAD